MPFQPLHSTWCELVKKWRFRKFFGIYPSFLFSRILQRSKYSFISRRINCQKSISAIQSTTSLLFLLIIWDYCFSVNSSLKSITYSSVKFGFFLSSNIWCWLHWRHAQKKLFCYSIRMCDENILNFNSEIERRFFSWNFNMNKNQNKTKQPHTKQGILISFALKNVGSFIWIQRCHRNITCIFINSRSTQKKQMVSKTVPQQRCVI